jgi:hypothetical protein
MGRLVGGLIGRLIDGWVDLWVDEAVNVRMLFLTGCIPKWKYKNNKNLIILN